MPDSRPYRGYIFISSEKSGKLALVLAHAQPGTMAPTNTWANARTKAINALKDRPNMFTIDGMRSIHFVLSYSKYKQYGGAGNGGLKFDDWVLYRQDTLRWLEAGVTEVIQVTKHNNNGVKVNTAGPHSAGVPVLT